MPSKIKITLDWYQDMANVYEHIDGHVYEVGTLQLKTLVAVIVGVTYYHHLLPIFDPREDETLYVYREDIYSYRRELEKILKKIKRLSKNHSEISEKKLIKNDHEFVDLAISIDFPEPFLPIDSYKNMVVEKILPYIKLLGSVHSLELIKKG